MMRKRPLGWPDLHGLTAGMDELTQEHEEHEEEHQEYTNTNTIQEPFSLTGQSNRPNRIHKRVGDWQVRYKKGSWMVVSPTANRAVPIKSPEDERLASS